MTLCRRVCALALALALLVPTLAHADAVDDGVRRVALELRCPVCEGQTVADSPSGLARDMRALIRTKVLAGEADQQILDEFVASYGDGILTEPPKRGISLGVWVGPIVAVGLGLAVLAALLRTWRRTALPAATPVGAALAVDSEVVDEFQRFRQELGR